MLDRVLLEVDGLGFFYEQDLTQRKVVNDISFKIYEGEAVQLVVVMVRQVLL